MIFSLIKIIFEFFDIYKINRKYRRYKISQIVGLYNIIYLLLMSLFPFCLLSLGMTTIFKKNLRSIIWKRYYSHSFTTTCKRK